MKPDYLIDRNAFGQTEVQVAPTGNKYFVMGARTEYREVADISQNDYLKSTANFKNYIGRPNASLKDFEDDEAKPTEEFLFSTSSFNQGTVLKPEDSLRQKRIRKPTDRVNANPTFNYNRGNSPGVSLDYMFQRENATKDKTRKRVFTTKRSGKVKPDSSEPFVDPYDAMFVD